MCTATFVPRGDGFYLAMNRDERIARPKARPPAIFQGAIKAIYPLDPEGGTWIGANDRRAAFTLLNWNDSQILHEKTRTRGCVIPAIINSADSQVVRSTLRQLDLQGILPFRLVGFFPAERSVLEWQWDQRALEHNSIPWTMRQWSSSSLSDATATSIRGKMLEEKAREHDTGSLVWLRSLHASHDQVHRDFSHCVHREKVETVSYTELVCSSESIACNYFSCSPCKRDQVAHSVSLP